MKSILLITTLILFNQVFGQHKAILFLDNKSAAFSPSEQFSQRSIDRRIKQNISWDDNDKPVNPNYIEQLNQFGIVLNKSRWLNAVSYETNMSLEDLRNKFDFIISIREVGKDKQSVKKELELATKLLDYGVGFEQVDQINVNCLHDLGFMGEGVYLAVIDAGFNSMDTIVYFDNVYNESRLLDTRNFVAGGTQVYNSSGHGTAVSSCIVGEKGAPDQFAGTAVDVDLALHLTEDVGSETEIEEFNLVASLERCDTLGVDVANISLGYFDFDDPGTSHVYADLDGNTTVAAVGVNIAATKGIAVVMSAGNSGPSNIITPCDADNGLCVGAVDEFDQYAGFSSIGPSADGQVKPDIAARGLDAWVVSSGSGTLAQSSGTSFSSPIMAGAVACLRQAHPSASVSEIFDAIRQSASQALSPDEFLGFGIPDFCVAHSILTQAGLQEIEALKLSVFPNPVNDMLTINLESEEVEIIELVNLVGQVIGTYKVSGKTIIDISTIAAGTYTLSIKGESGVSERLTIIH